MYGFLFKAKSDVYIEYKVEIMDTAGQVRVKK